MITAAHCMRLQGHSVVICRCRTADGFLPCPDAERGRLTPTYPPEAYRRAAHDPEPEKLRDRSRIASGTNNGALNFAAGNAKQPPVLKVYQGGYTGSICDQCGSARMRRSGTCETCEECGNAGGCG